MFWYIKFKRAVKIVRPMIGGYSDLLTARIQRLCFNSLTTIFSFDQFYGKKERPKQEDKFYCFVTKNKYTIYFPVHFESAKAYFQRMLLRSSKKPVHGKLTTSIRY